MLIVYAILVTLWSFWVWTGRENVKEDVEGLTAENTQLTTEKEFYRNVIVKMYEKPVYALITNEQVQQIGKVVADHVKEPKWLN